MSSSALEEVRLLPRACVTFPRISAAHSHVAVGGAAACAQVRQTLEDIDGLETGVVERLNKKTKTVGGTCFSVFSLWCVLCCGM
jgi:hypothetical protein